MNVNKCEWMWTNVNECEQMWINVNKCEQMWTNENNCMFLKQKKIGESKIKNIFKNKQIIRQVMNWNLTKIPRTN